jgi:hypothetical protein
MLHAYYFLYKKYSIQNHIPIDFGNLKKEKDEYFKYLYGSIKWMSFFYIFERIKIVFLEFFTYNQIINTFILVFGIIFIAIASYSTYLSYKISNRVQKLYLPPLNSFQSFFQYFQNLGGMEEEYKGIREGFYDVIVTVPPTPITAMNANQLDTRKIKRGSGDFIVDEPDEVIYSDNTVQIMNKFGYTNENTEFNSFGISMNTLCERQKEENVYGIRHFMLDKSSKNVIYIADYDGRFNNDMDINAVYNYFGAYRLFSVIAISRQSEYRDSNVINLIFDNLDHNLDVENGIFLLDNVKNIYNIQHKSKNDNEFVYVNIYPNHYGLYYNVTRIETPFKTNKIGKYLLSYDNNDLFFIKTQNCATNTIEVHILGIESGYKEFKLSTGTPLIFDGMNSCTWYADLDPDNPVDKKYMDLINATEYRLSGGIGFYLLNSKRDLYYVKTVDTRSKMVEIHGLSAASNYQQFCLHCTTALRIAYITDDTTRPFGNKWYTFGLGTFELDENDNLVYIKPLNKNNGIASSFTVFTLSAAKNYKRYIR